MKSLSAGSALLVTSNIFENTALRSACASSVRSKWICQQCSARLNDTQMAQRIARAKGFASLRNLSSYGINPSEVRLGSIRYRSASSDSNHGRGFHREDLPSQEEGRRSHLARRFSNVMDHLQSNIFIAGQRLNDLTGYSGIEALKKDIDMQGSPPMVRADPSALTIYRTARPNNPPSASSSS